MNYQIDWMNIQPDWVFDRANRVSDQVRWMSFRLDWMNKMDERKVANIYLEKSRFFFSSEGFL